MKRFKRPEWFIELANRLPQYDFVMIGNMYSNNYGRKIGRAVDNGPSNLAYLGKSPIDQVNQEIAKSDLLTYTSVPGGEGFGNSFLTGMVTGCANDQHLSVGWNTRAGRNRPLCSHF